MSGQERGRELEETRTGGWGNEIGSHCHPVSRWSSDPDDLPRVRPDELEMGRGWANGGISMSLDNRVVLGKPQPSHLINEAP